ncbi:cation-translocating P-type ATPase [Mycoplasma sp. Ms02]|uniref:cation-translocating P-type ATPase n=1 Tax=Mycoplasma sp. Ms02 TaxID=353851 RepID=UPI001C8AE332|nr:cation-translocating P-type ATPase [Mycoplasma sp. Ms02]QZE12631.1 cation-translocating P-type ATPase [Mycoplasma sp. Ms02]
MKQEVNIEVLETDITTGLNDEQVLKQREKHGLNLIHGDKKLNPFVAFFRQFKDFMIILLMIAVVLSFSIAIYETSAHPKSTSETVISFVEPIIILVVVVLNSMLGAYQEIKSDQAVRALEKVNELTAKVIRNGRMMIIKSEEIVPGDILIVEAGDTISADAILKESNNLQVVEASLTGENESVSKSWDAKVDDSKILAEQKNKIFSGTYVTNGRGLALVVATGANTVIGTINKTIQEQEGNLSPLQQKLNRLSKLFGYSGIALLIVSFILQVLISNLFTGDWSKFQVYSNSLVTAISLAVAAIPEGLITFTTVILAIGVSKMTRENAIIKSFPTIETLGSANIICSDKTGTLTQNKMTVMDIFFENSLMTDTDTKDFNKVLEAMIVASDASVHVDENGKYEEVGDPTETGILIAGLEKGIVKSDLYQKMKRLDSLPFDSDRKMMSVLVEKAGYNLIFTKGAPDVILSKSNGNLEFAKEVNEKWANMSYRVLAVGVQKVSKEKTKLDFSDENNMEFVGLIAMMDPPREEVKQSIHECLAAGIKPVMITGDHLTTAVAIGRNLGIYKQGDTVITGAELSQWSQEELEARVHEVSIYARVNPEDKLRIVKAWQKRDMVVAMTGDGVNDAPALKAADIGCAMGITGTDVSKQAADVILTDDNFSTIVKAVKGGREVYDKIKTVIQNLLVSSLVEIIVMLFGLFVFRFIFKEYIGAEADFWVLSASQLLWINLLTHGLPAIALGMVKPKESDVMSRKPFSKKESVFSRGMGWRLAYQSVVLSVLSIAAYLIIGIIAANNNVRGEEFVKLTSTACFVTMGIGASLNSLSLMSTRSLFVCNIYYYRLVYLASMFSLVCVIFAAYIPGVNSVFKMYDNPSYDFGYWFIPVVLGLGLTAANEGWKILENKKIINFNK